MQLNETQIERYAHHIILKDIGGEGQKKLLSSRVLIVGAGGLGSPAALYLAAAGVGILGIVDDDLVDLSNLQRQILHSSGDVGRQKVESAKEKLAALNSDVRVVDYPFRLTKKNISDIIDQYDFIIDGSDNFATKFMINDACVQLKKPYSHAGVIGFKGQVFTYIPGSMCYRCIFTEEPPPGTIQDCRGTGIVGAVAGTIGSIQAAETIKFLLGKGDLLTNRLIKIDLLNAEIRSITIPRNKNCPLCKDQSTITSI